MNGDLHTRPSDLLKMYALNVKLTVYEMTSLIYRKKLKPGHFFWPTAGTMAAIGCFNRNKLHSPGMIYISRLQVTSSCSF